jgi:hypothetical protein
MKQKSTILPGQNIRYIGRGFRGYVKGQPYMIFIAYHGIYEVLVRYNNADIKISKSDIQSVEKAVKK